MNYNFLSAHDFLDQLANDYRLVRAIDVYVQEHFKGETRPLDLVERAHFLESVRLYNEMTGLQTIPPDAPSTRDYAGIELFLKDTKEVDKILAELVKNKTFQDLMALHPEGVVITDLKNYLYSISPYGAFEGANLLKMYQDHEAREVEAGLVWELLTKSGNAIDRMMAKTIVRTIVRSPEPEREPAKTKPDDLSLDEFLQIRQKELGADHDLVDIDEEQGAYTAKCQELQTECTFAGIAVNGAPPVEKPTLLSMEMVDYFLYDIKKSKVLINNVLSTKSFQAEAARNTDSEKDLRTKIYLAMPTAKEAAFEQLKHYTALDKAARREADRAKKQIAPVKKVENPEVVQARLKQQLRDFDSKIFDLNDSLRIQNERNEELVAYTAMAEEDLVNARARLKKYCSDLGETFIDPSYSIPDTDNTRPVEKIAEISTESDNRYTSALAQKFNEKATVINALNVNYGLLFAKNNKLDGHLQRTQGNVDLVNAQAEIMYARICDLRNEEAHREEMRLRGTTEPAELRI